MASPWDALALPPGWRCNKNHDDDPGGNAGLRLFLMATWKSGLGNDIYYIHHSVKPVKWPVADGGEEKVVFLREFF